jgi:hypothetical protein
MQEHWRKIFKMACEEIPHRIFIFGKEYAVIYRGFRISELEGKYEWKDMRRHSFYDKVDPVVTQHILKKGFLKTLTELMVHDDHERLYQLEKKVGDINSEIKYWTNKSSENYRHYKVSEVEIITNTMLETEQIEYKTELLNKKYIINKNLYAKKRRVLKEEKKKVGVQITFYKSRVKLYN